MPKQRTIKVQLGRPRKGQATSTKKSMKAMRKEQEVTWIGQALRSLGGIGGGALGSYLGSGAVGAAAGTGLGATLSRWLGQGDYEIQRNSIVSGTMRADGSIPDMHKTSQSIVVRHKEFIGPIVSSQGFRVQQSFDINPGNYTLFPWLSGVATRFQEYKVRGMVFHYIPTSGAAVSSTNAALGSVMLQTSYRSSDTAPESKVEMLNEYCSNESVPSASFCHPVECDPKENPFNIQYVRSTTLTNREDKLLYDLGTTHVAVQGCQTNDIPIGDLWVTYEIELKKPIVSSNVTATTRSFGAVIAAPATSGTIFNGSTTSYGTLPVTLNNNTITFPRGTRGNFQISVRLASTAGFDPFTWATPATYANCASQNGPTGETFLGTAKAAGGVLFAGTYLCWVVVNDNASDATVTIPTPSALTGPISNTAITITWYNNLF